MSGQFPPGEWGGFKPNGGSNGRREKFKWQDLHEIKVRPLEFVLKPWLQKNSFHLLVGIKNAGKGTWLSHWAAKVTRGELGPKTRVLWIAIGEDSYATDVRPRIEAAGGDTSKITVLVGGQFTLPDAVDELERVCKRYGDVGMVIIDPLGGGLASNVNTNYDFEVRPALAALNTAADKLECIILGVRHLSIKAEKRQGGVLSAVLGATDWVNIPRAVLMLAHDDEDSELRHLFIVAGNRVRDDTPGLLFRIVGVKPEGWDEEITLAKEIGESLKDPDELLILKRKRKESRTDAGKQMIGEILAVEPGFEMESDLLDAEVAKRTGLSVRTIVNSRKYMREIGLLRARPEKDEFGTVTRWFSLLTKAGVRDFVTDVEPSSPTDFVTQASGPENPEAPLIHTPFRASGDLQEFSPNGVSRSPTSAGVRQATGATGQLVTTDFHDFVTAGDWVEAEGYRLDDEELVAALAERFGVAEGDSFGLVDIAYDCRQRAST